MTDALHLSLRRPAALCAAVSFLHLTALGCAWIALEGWALMLVTIGAALSWLAEWRHLRVQTLDLVCRPDGGLALAGPTGRRPVTLEGSAQPASWLTVICMRDRRGRREALIITPDRVDAAAFRRLRVWLRWHRGAAFNVSD